MSTNGSTKPQIVTTAPPSHVATLTDAVDSWAVEAFNSGEYSPQQHARLAAAVLAGFVPIVGEICDGKITFYAGANLAK